MVGSVKKAQGHQLDIRAAPEPVRLEANDLVLPVPVLGTPRLRGVDALVAGSLDLPAPVLGAPTADIVLRRLVDRLEHLLLHHTDEWHAQHRAELADIVHAMRRAIAGRPLKERERVRAALAKLEAKEGTLSKYSHVRLASLVKTSRDTVRRVLNERAKSSA